MGFDGEKLLEGLRNGTILSLPKIYPRQKLPFRVVQIPMTRTLKLGETYEFTVEYVFRLGGAILIDTSPGRNGVNTSF